MRIVRKDSDNLPSDNRAEEEKKQSQIILNSESNHSNSEFSMNSEISIDVDKIKKIQFQRMS